MTRWLAVERPDGRVDRRALLGLRSPSEGEVRSLPRPAAVAGCTGCGTCVAVCPTGAMTQARLPTTVVIGVDPTACTGCGECVARCPESVLAPAATLPGPQATAPVRLARVRVGRCDRCRAPLHPGEGPSCTACATRRGVMDDVWAHLG
ncbi:4Fe-4S dicluster domain-containing protein [Mobilicoccus caccae]|uniref:4Fe-4S ferredoxin-type domain-containing protein n=1 Tax=Mobilicoccus caccae TaxID=1859295 RepID=A0ABQ6IMI9_9MICO|nr:4Fe-4S dicluster domain-containing protein [Mobilicoccus caccae]GMA39144.1 hypothetical protein GCM10025883_11890 [Mobilicoccus caccae]